MADAYSTLALSKLSANTLLIVIVCSESPVEQYGQRPLAPKSVKPCNRHAAHLETVPSSKKGLSSLSSAGGLKYAPFPLRTPLMPPLRFASLLVLPVNSILLIRTPICC